MVKRSWFDEFDFCGNNFNILARVFTCFIINNYL